MNTITPFELAQLAAQIAELRGGSSVDDGDLLMAVRLVLACGKAIADYRESKAEGQR